MCGVRYSFLWSLQKVAFDAGVMAQWLRTLAKMFPRPVAAHPIASSSSRGSESLFGPPHTPVIHGVHRHTYRQILIHVK